MVKYRVQTNDGYIEFGSRAEADAHANGSLVEEINENLTPRVPTQEDIEDELFFKSASFMGAGNLIADELEKRIWARNGYLKSQNQPLTMTEMNNLLSISMGIDKALRTGSLVTASAALNQLKSTLPAYADIVDWAIKTLNYF